MVWPAAGFADTQFGCFMKQDVATSPKTPDVACPIQATISRSSALKKRRAPLYKE